MKFLNAHSIFIAFMFIYKKVEKLKNKKKKKNKNKNV